MYGMIYHMFSKIEKSKKKIIDKVVDRFIKILPDFLTGKSEIYEKKFMQAYGKSDYKEEILLEKRKIAKLYIFLILAILIILLAFFSNNESNKVPDKIKRDNVNGVEKNVNVKITAEDEKNKAEKKVDITVRKKELTDDQKILRINKIYDELDKKILSENKNLNNVNSNLNLIKDDESSGVKISWESSNETAIIIQGVINALYAKKNMSIILTAKLSLENLYKEKKIEIKIGDNVKENEKDLENLIVQESKKLSEDLSGN